MLSQAAVAMEPVPKKDEASEDAENLVRGVAVLKLPHFTFSISFSLKNRTADFRIYTLASLLLRLRTQRICLPIPSLPARPSTFNL